MKRIMFGKSDSQNRGKIKQFFDKRGFYVVLFLCLMIIGTTAFLVTRTNLNYLSQSGGDSQTAMENGPVENQQGKADVSTSTNTADPDKKVTVATDQQAKQPVVEKKVVQKQPIANQKVASATTQKGSTPKMVAANSQTQAAQQMAAKKIDKLMLPVQGEIIVTYAKDTMVFSKTMNDWRIHEGIDIKGDVGTQVKAGADGIVEKAYKDDKLGFTIIINHGNGIQTKYCNLSSIDMVKEKQAVKMGDVIGGIGETAAYESADLPHLHFEVIENGKSQDSQKYFVQ